MTDSEMIAAFADCIDLACADVGGRAICCTDDFFASVDNLLKPGPAVFDPDAYTDRGKLMDGWESRRERVPGDDVAVLALGLAGQLHGVDIDTSHFLGNHPPFASLDVTTAPADADATWLRDHVTWTTVLSSVPLKRGSHNLFGVRCAGSVTHVRLRIHPDGGVARLRVYGRPDAPPPDTEHDLAALASGGQALACSDMFFSPMQNLLRTERSTFMGGGWETRRSRPPGMDWIIVALSGPGSLTRLTLDTGWFKGNFPDRAAVDALFWPDAPAHLLVAETGWTEILPPTRMRAHTEHQLPISDGGPWTHLRLRILPDGGMARLRAWGMRTDVTPAQSDPTLSWLNALPEQDCCAVLQRCCGSAGWARAMAEARPFTSRVHMHGLARQLWWECNESDWLEAFTHHPKIGSDVGKLREKFGATADWSEGEQSGVTGAAEATLLALAAGNRTYEEEYGFIFIVCASGLSAAEMLHRLQERLDQSRDQEVRRAAGEQSRITALRIDKLAPPSPSQS